jgi:hypothetical protein
MNQEQEQFYNFLRDSGEFNDWQLSIISLGLKNGYSTDQVALYADPKFDGYQMGQILRAFEDGLTEDQVAVFADPTIKYEDMRVIRHRLSQPERTSVRVKPPVQRTGKNR